MTDAVSRVARLFPGILAGTAVGLCAWLAARALGAQVAWAPDAVVMALLFGMLLRMVRAMPASLEPGVDFLGRQVLEVAIVLLGLGTDLRRVATAGPLLAVCVVATTLFALGAGIVIARRFGLTTRPAFLVASGNAICGNTAIVAVGRAIGATAMETATAIASTALLSIVLVLALPIASAGLHLDDAAYGALVGMTVYAMPQVLAATFPVSAAAGEIGTIVKLLRVLLLLPWLAWLGHRSGARRDGAGDAIRRVLPPYLLLFLLAAVVRTLGAVPSSLAMGAQVSAHALTVGAMAAVGLSVDPAALREAGVRTTGASLSAMLVLVAVSLGVVYVVLR